MCPGPNRHRSRSVSVRFWSLWSAHGTSGSYPWGKFAGAVPPGSSVLVSSSGNVAVGAGRSHGSRGRWGRSSNLSWAGAAVVAIGVGCVLACEKLRAALPRRRGTLGCPAAPGAATPDLATMPGGAGSERTESASGSAYYCTGDDTPIIVRSDHGRDRKKISKNHRLTRFRKSHGKSIPKIRQSSSLFT